MNLEVFCYVGLLRFPEQLEPALALLPGDQKTRAMEILAGVKDLRKPELLRRWSKLRESEVASIRRTFQQRTGVSLDELSPIARRHYLDWLIEQNG